MDPQNVPEELTSTLAAAIRKGFGPFGGLKPEAEALAWAAVAAVLPSHEALVRAKVAEEIEAAIPDKLYGQLELHAAAGQRMAAKIARGGQ